MPTYFDERDKLLCITPFGAVESDIESEADFNEFIARIKEQGIHPYGCFSCSFFSTEGCGVSTSVTIGFCLFDADSRTPDLSDLTNLFCSCDAFAPKLGAQVDDYC